MLKNIEENQLLSTNHHQAKQILSASPGDDLCSTIDFLQYFLTPAHPHAQSLFLFPIVFGINLIEFFDAS